jgi:hypothetical protein
MNIKKLQKEVRRREKIQKALAWLGLFTLIGLFGLGLSFIFRAIMILIEIL